MISAKRYPHFAQHALHTDIHTAYANQTAYHVWTELGAAIGAIGLTGSGYPEQMSRLERITVDPAVCHGQPVVRGMRYPVQSLLELLSSGMTIEDVLADYPDLERRTFSPHWSSAR
jgi:uncharacterized protein (DUF433 family)